MHWLGYSRDKRTVRQGRLPRLDTKDRRYQSKSIQGEKSSAENLRERHNCLPSNALRSALARFQSFKNDSTHNNISTYVFDLLIYIVVSFHFKPKDECCMLPIIWKNGTDTAAFRRLCKLISSFYKTCLWRLKTLGLPKLNLWKLFSSNIFVI